MRSNNLFSLIRPPARGLAALLLLCSGFVRPVDAGEIGPGARDSASLAAAIQRAAAGDTVRLPDGVFAITQPVELKSGIKLIGAGQDKTRIVYRGGITAPLMRIEGCQEVEVAQLTLDGEDNPLVRDGIAGGNSRRLYIHHVTLRDLGKDCASFSHGIIFSGHNPTMERGVTDSVIADCHFERIGLKAEYGGAIRLAWGSVRNRIERNVVNGTGRGGIFGDHSAELVIRENRVTGSGGEGLGIEIWGGCPRSVIEDNFVDHWLSVDAVGQGRCAVRRNVVGTADGTVKFLGIEIIARDTVVTDNLVKRGARIGLSVSNKPVKNNVFWGYNTVSDCIQWGAQFQGESGGIAHHYLYRCVFEHGIQGSPQAIYPNDSGHGFRFNGSCRGMVFEECDFRNNGGYGVQIGGKDVDALTFLGCVFTNDSLGPVIGISPEMTVEFRGGKGAPPASARAFPEQQPVVDFTMPRVFHAGVEAQFHCTSTAAKGGIRERLWDFGHGIPDVAANPAHIFEKPGKYRVTLVVWDGAGRGARAERNIEVAP